MKSVGACFVITIAVLAFLFHAWINDAAPPPIQLWVRPQIAFAPLDVLIVLVRLRPAEEDRALIVRLDSGSFYRSSRDPLEGTRSVPLHRFEWRGLPAGIYDVDAQVWTSTIPRLAATASLRVIAP